VGAEIFGNGAAVLVCNSVVWIFRCSWASAGAGVGLEYSFLAAQIFDYVGE
jgi:hypothetical protein